MLREMRWSACRLGGRVGLLALLSTMAVLVTASPASAGTKPFSVVLTGGVGTNGTNVTAVFTNENKTQRLGSANLTAPAGFTLTSATISQGTVQVVGNTVQLRNLDLKAGKSLTVTINVSSSPCSTSSWSVVAKQANNFNGRGNGLNLDTAKSNLVTALCTAPCNGNASCSTDLSNPNGGASVAASTGQSSGSAFESANPSQFALPLTCNNPDGTTYVSSDKNVFDFITPEDRNKVVTLTLIDVPAAGFSLEAQQICFNAPYEFTTLAGTAAPADPVLGGFTGLLPDCLAEQVGPCHDRESDQAVSDPNDPDGLDVTLVADIPKGLPGDPHMR